MGRRYAAFSADDGTLGSAEVFGYIDRKKLMLPFLIYFLCETKTTDIFVDAEEVTDYRWVNIQAAEKLIVFDSLKHLLRNAEAFTNKRRKES